MSPSTVGNNVPPGGEWVRPDQRVRVFRDEPVNRILECAVFGKADLIVTGVNVLTLSWAKITLR